MTEKPDISQAVTELAQLEAERGGTQTFSPSCRTRREHIEASLDDMITDLFYYDRKEDEDLPVSAIEEAVKAGEITEAEIIERVAERLREALRGEV